MELPRVSSIACWFDPFIDTTFHTSFFQFPYSAISKQRATITLYYQEKAGMLGHKTRPQRSSTDNNDSTPHVSWILLGNRKQTHFSEVLKDSLNAPTHNCQHLTCPRSNHLIVPDFKQPPSAYIHINANKVLQLGAVLHCPRRIGRCFLFFFWFVFLFVCFNWIVLSLHREWLCSTVSWCTYLQCPEDGLWDRKLLLFIFLESSVQGIG